MRRAGLFSLLLAVFCSCYSPRYVYLPTAAMVPNVSTKGDADGNIAYAVNPFGTGEIAAADSDRYHISRGLDIQGAYAFSKKFFFLASYSGRREKASGNVDINLLPDSLSIFYKRQYATGAFGYYKMFRDSSMQLQLMAGYGAGNITMQDYGIKNGDHNYRRNIKIHQAKYFLQPTIIFKKPGANVFLSSRFSAVKFRRSSTDYSLPELVNHHLDDQTFSHTYFFWEPAVGLQWKVLPQQRFYLNTEAAFSFLQSKTFVDNRFMNVSVGLSYIFHKMGNKAKK